ncbi:hypothetical protein AN958_04068 [Leucoagaricus sp. SymC.cos]|nr:hypothetical protein AN958_04068 [Leucoagaricus sp. SymC.cos]
MLDNTAGTRLSSTSTEDWTVERIHALIESYFHKRPCWYQIKVAQALFKRRHVIGCAATGAGKTLSFWIALLMARADGHERTAFVVTPLNLLGKQNADMLMKAGISAIAMSHENANDQVFKGMDLSNVEIVVQWTAPSDMSTLWQRFGRAARGDGFRGTGILLVTKRDTNDERERIKERACQRELKKKDATGRQQLSHLLYMVVTLRPLIAQLIRQK